MNPSSTGESALAGVKVLALEVSVSGPHCTRMLGDMGADVIRIEKPKEGDLIRHWDGAVRGLSSGYVWLNYNKRSFALDVKSPAGLEILQRLVKTVDVFVENFAPGVATRLGLGYDELRATNPRLIYCSISGYGQGGPYKDVKAYDLLIQGEAGIIATTGSENQPAKVSVPIADLACSMYAVTGILAALYQRQKTGRGQYIDVSWAWPWSRPGTTPSRPTRRRRDRRTAGGVRDGAQPGPVAGHLARPARGDPARAPLPCVSDAAGDALPLHPGAADCWPLFALSGGCPVTVVGEWTRRGLWPLTTWAQGGRWCDCERAKGGVEEELKAQGRGEDFERLAGPGHRESYWHRTCTGSYIPDPWLAPGGRHNTGSCGRPARPGRAADGRSPGGPTARPGGTAAPVRAGPAPRGKHGRRPLAGADARRRVPRPAGRMAGRGRGPRSSAATSVSPGPA